MNNLQIILPKKCFTYTSNYIQKYNIKLQNKTKFENYLFKLISIIYFLTQLLLIILLI